MQNNGDNCETCGLNGLKLSNVNGVTRVEVPQDFGFEDQGGIGPMLEHAMAVAPQLETLRGQLMGNSPQLAGCHSRALRACVMSMWLHPRRCVPGRPCLIRSNFTLADTPAAAVLGLFAEPVEVAGGLPPRAILRHRPGGARRLDGNKDEWPKNQPCGDAWTWVFPVEIEHRLFRTVRTDITEAGKAEGRVKRSAVAAMLEIWRASDVTQRLPWHDVEVFERLLRDAWRPGDAHENSCQPNCALRWSPLDYELLDVTISMIEPELGFGFSGKVTEAADGSKWHSIEVEYATYEFTVEYVFWCDEQKPGDEF